MKKITLLFIALFALINFSQAAEKNHLVIVNSFQKPQIVAQGKPLEKQIQQLNENGFSPYLIQTDDYPPLRKGLWAIVLGPFDAETAKTKQQNVQTWVKDAYIKTVKPPVAKQEKYGFSTLNTRIDNKYCIAIIDNIDEGYSVNLCQSLSGYQVSNVVGNEHNSLEITKEKQEYHFGADVPYAFFIKKYPQVTWIYKDSRLIALSAVNSIPNENNIELPDVLYRFVSRIGEQEFCLVDKPFKVDDINAVLTYLNDNPSNCP